MQFGAIDYNRITQQNCWCVTDVVQAAGSTLIEYRSFLNTDPPLLVDLWNRLPKISGLVERTDYTTLERHVFAKPYFDREGVSIALEGDKIIGFAHAGFSPQESLAELDYQTGIVSQLRLAPSVSDGSVANKLLTMSVDYCRSKGATTVHAGSFFPHSPFYLGLYGGSRLPGVIEQDDLSLAGFKEFGFVEHDQIIILELQLSELKSIMGRQQMSVRRNFLINATSDPLEQSWWESCTLGVAGRERFTVINKRSKEVSGTVSYWDMQPLSDSFSGKARGLYNLSIAEDLRRGGIATYLVGESLKHLAKSDVTMVEAQTRSSDAASQALFEKLGFKKTSSGTLLSYSLG